MLFTSWIFLFGFLPIAIFGYECAARLGQRCAVYWLVLVSLVFYGFWQPALTILIAASITFNFLVATLIRKNLERPRVANTLLWSGIAVDLLALVYYKYTNWILASLIGFGVLHLEGVHRIILPLGISFFTFTQIGYLVDCRQEVAKDGRFRDYALFVTFFPHLIAGPILHNGEMMPQFAKRENYGLRYANVAAGLTYFIIGLLKKSLIADPMSGANDEAFRHAQDLQLLGSWGATLGYSAQLYFDFSGYSDMAIGLALIFNFKFPLNFNSPYKATSIIDFWQRWHMTLTRYITLYVYNPIAMWLLRKRAARGLPIDRKALARPGSFAVLVAVPTTLTMLLAGIWHGAGAQFVVFGLLHGIYLTVNHLWRAFGPKTQSLETHARRWVGKVWSASWPWLLTYLCVLIGQVFFRADSVSDAMSLLQGMAGLKGVEHPVPLPAALGPMLGAFGQRLANLGDVIFNLSQGSQLQLLLVPLAFGIARFLPNSQQIMASAEPVLADVRTTTTVLSWRPAVGWAVLMGVATVLALLSIGGTHEFLYFQF
jgi:D-alanyl-lipoteichoic acid acyltransferase DltB (MBOAT superfamily)